MTQPRKDMFGINDRTLGIKLTQRTLAAQTVITFQVRL